MNTSLAKTSMSLLLLGLMYTACKKDNIDKSDEDRQPQQIEVELNTAYMPGQLVDSAIALWETGGTKQSVRLVQNGNKFTAPLNNFTRAGNGTMTVQLFTQTKMDQIPLQWEKQFTHALDRSKKLHLQAPTNIHDAGWYPRAICKSDMNEANFTAILALKPEDTYFELKDVHPSIAKRIEVVRSFFTNDTATLVASRGWVGSAQDLGASGILQDRNHFRHLPEQINGRGWERVKVRASFYKELNPHQIIEAEFVYDKL